MQLDQVFIHEVSPRKVRVTREGVLCFNATWPCSELRSERAYWFEFAENGDLIDTDVPEHEDGGAATALADDCRKWLEGVRPCWLR